MDLSTFFQYQKDTNGERLSVHILLPGLYEIFDRQQIPIPALFKPAAIHDGHSTGLDRDRSENLHYFLPPRTQRLFWFSSQPWRSSRLIIFSVLSVSLRQMLLPVINNHRR